MCYHPLRGSHATVVSLYLRSRPTGARIRPYRPTHSVVGGLPLNAAAHLYSYRDLLANLVIRDLKVRYKKSALGFVWSLLNPLLMMVVFTIVFTILTVPNIENFPVFVLTGLVAWNFFANSIMGAAFTVVGNSTLINKVYFPRELLPASLVVLQPGQLPSHPAGAVRLHPGLQDPASPP